jgi:ABC-type uncharacterized transport system permease subunit
MFVSDGPQFQANLAIQSNALHVNLPNSKVQGQHVTILLFSGLLLTSQFDILSMNT